MKVRIKILLKAPRQDLNPRRALTGTLLHVLVPEVIPDDHNCRDTKDDQAVDDSRGERGLEGYILLIAGGRIDTSICCPCVRFTGPVGSCILSDLQRPVLADKRLRNGSITFGMIAPTAIAIGMISQNMLTPNTVRQVQRLRICYLLLS